MLVKKAIGESNHLVSVLLPGTFLKTHYSHLEQWYQLNIIISLFSNGMNHPVLPMYFLSKWLIVYNSIITFYGLYGNHNRDTAYLKQFQYCTAFVCLFNISLKAIKTKFNRSYRRRNRPVMLIEHIGLWWCHRVPTGSNDLGLLALINTLCRHCATAYSWCASRIRLITNRRFFIFFNICDNLWIPMNVIRIHVNPHSVCYWRLLHMYLEDREPCNRNGNGN